MSERRMKFMDTTVSGVVRQTRGFLSCPSKNSIAKLCSRKAISNRIEVASARVFRWRTCRSPESHEMAEPEKRLFGSCGVLGFCGYQHRWWLVIAGCKMLKLLDGRASLTIHSPT